jgi:hypothetical protein
MLERDGMRSMLREGRVGGHQTRTSPATDAVGWRQAAGHRRHARHGRRPHPEGTREVRRTVGILLLSRGRDGLPQALARAELRGLARRNDKRLAGAGIAPLTGRPRQH